MLHLTFSNLSLGKINIGRVELENPDIYLYTDSSGYTNTSLFKKNNPPKKNAPKNLDYPILQINHGMLSVDKEDKHKFFGYDINKLECHIQGNDG